MQEQRKFQLRHRSKFSQLILLDNRAMIISSCNSIFDTQELLQRPVTEWFPFLESIFPQIWAMDQAQSNIFFNKIETPIPELPGIYDFTFSKVILDQQELLLWSIYDYTDLYEDFRQFQQRKNELEIHRERLERRFQSLASKEDIDAQQNIIIENLDHLQLTYYNKIKSALITPINALDGLTFLLSNALSQRNTTYAGHLKHALGQLHQILEELENLDISEQSNLQMFLLEDIIADIKQLFKALSLDIKVAPDILSTPFYGNSLYLRQILFGLLNNANNLHPQSKFTLAIKSFPRPSDQVRQLSFELREFLSSQSVFLAEEAYVTMIYRLSVIKQIIDIQGGTIQVDKDPKTLSISIQITLDYNLTPQDDI